MGKICDRVYKADTMFSLKMINGIACCPSCDQPAVCHNTTVEARVLFWALLGSTGTSSKAIARHMTGYVAEQPFAFMPPSDADDRSRCIRLLQLIPEWIPRLKEMVKYDAPREREPSLVINSSGISADRNTWERQIPIIMQEGKL